MPKATSSNPNGTMAGPRRVSLKGAILLLVVAISAILGTIVLLTPGFLALPFSLALYTRCGARAVSLWLGLMLFVFGVRLKISGHHQPVRGPCLIILNHRTRFDWLYLWCYLFRLGDITKLKVILKDSLKKAPLFGWGMQAAQFLFISRKWSSDEKHIADTIAYFDAIELPVQLLIFPEGTDLSESNKAKSQQFAEQNGLPRYDYVLHPRTRGFVHCLQEMRKGKVQPSLLNLSVGYVGAIPQNERDLLAGNWPKEIHFHGQVLNQAELPEDNAGLEKWLKARWQEKEEQLEHFYTQEQFEGPYMDDKDVYSRTVVVGMVLHLTFWAILMALLTYWAYSSTLFWWYHIPAAVILWGFTYFVDLDCLILRYHRRQRANL